MPITIDKAIKDLQARIAGEFSIKGIDKCEDMKIGIEALKETKRLRKFKAWFLKRVLPGETKE